MATRGITLNKSVQSRPFVENRGEGYRLRIETTDAEGMPAEIFLHEQTLIDPYEEVTNEQFVCVTSVPDLTIYPVGVAGATQWPAFYRTSSIDIILFNQAMAEEAWTDIKAEVEVLIASLNKLELMGPAESYRAGDEATVEESQSLSESQSA
jgi:hypothetical protein